MKRSFTACENESESETTTTSISNKPCSAFHAYHHPQHSPHPPHPQHAQESYHSRHEHVEKRVRRRSGKRVSFSDSCSTESKSHQFPLHQQQITEEDYRTLWFQKDELVAAKQYMRYLILHGSEEEHGVDEMSGLHRYNMERSQHKRSAIHYVIEAYRSNPTNHEFVREVSKQCTGWARQVAEEEGFATFCQVYGDPVEINSTAWWEDDVSLFDFPINQTDDFGIETKTSSDSKMERIASVTPPPPASPTCVV